MKRIPVYIPSTPANALQYVNSAIRRNWISSICMDEEVNFIHKLETGFAELVGSKYAVSVTSGTAAVKLALASIKIEPGDEVIVPDFTMIASVSPIIQLGAIPVFVDVFPDTWCMNTELIEEKITDRTKAILPVHIYGYPADMAGIMEIAEKYNLKVIEDAAEAIGSKYHGKGAGSIGDLGCFSFYANKVITCGEGGIVTTSSEEFYKRACLLKDQAFSEPRFIHEELGYNFRMNNLSAAYAFASLEEAESTLKKKKKLAGLYSRYLSRIDGISLPPSSTDSVANSYWMYGIMIDKNKFGTAKREVRNILKNEYGIDSRDFFYPMHAQPVIQKKKFVGPTDRFPVADRLWECGLYLPSSTSLKEEDVQYVADSLKDIGNRQ